jgi:hypothetical protein
MMAAPLTLAVGDKFWLEDCDYPFTALRITADSSDSECWYVTTSLDELPILVCADDIVEILR